MKVKILLLFITVVISHSYGQKLDVLYVKGLKYNVPPATPLPLEYKTYHIEHYVDSLAPFLSGAPLSKNNFESFKKGFSSLELISNRQLVSTGGDIYFQLHAGAFSVRDTENILKPKKTNPAANGYLKRVNYSLPLRLVLYSKDGTVISEIFKRAASDVSTYTYGPNFKKIHGGSLWTPDEVFATSLELDAKFKEESKLVYDEIIMNVFRQSIDKDAKKVIEKLYIGYKNFSYSPRFYTAKVKGRQYDYSDLDTAYVAYAKAFNKLKLNAADQEVYRADFEKALKICLDAYNNPGQRMNFELKNGMLYNIATMYYHLGNPEEARKYVTKYKVDSWDYISTQNELYKPEYEKQDVHFVLFENYWGR